MQYDQELASVKSFFGSIPNEDVGKKFKIVNVSQENKDFYKLDETCTLVNVDMNNRYWMRFDTERAGGYVWQVTEIDVIKVD